MKKIIKWMSLGCALLIIASSIPEFRYVNVEQSRTIGSVRNGKIENAFLIPYNGRNYKYFSLMSYYVFNNAYTHSKLFNTILSAYEQCEETCPDVKFRLMECSDKLGGKMLFHRTHQNGMSVDFMVPKKGKGNEQVHFFDKIGMWHYLLDFTDSGKLILNKEVQIDFESIGKHILAVDKAAHENGLRIKKVIFNTQLKDDFFATVSGKKVKNKDIYFVRSLSDLVNRVHDDHYHIDFEEI